VALVVVASTSATAGTPTTSGTSTATRPSAGTAIGLGTRLINVQRAAAKLFAIQSRDGFLGFGSVGHFYECKSSGTSGVTIGDQADLIDFAVRLKQRAQFRFRGAVGEIANKKLLHGFPFSVSQRETSDFVGGFLVE
jgi:hypothetical protein